MKKSIVFDFGGVIFETSRRAMYAERFATQGRPEADVDYFLQNIFNKAANSEANRGTVKEVTDRLALQHPDWADDIRAFNADRDFIHNVRGLVPGMKETLQTLKAEGHKLFALTNWPSDAFQTLAKAYPDVVGLFNGIVVSGDVKMGKPDPRLFALAHSMYEHPDPANTLFFDDKPANIEAAIKTVGWQGHVFKDAATVRNLVAGLG
jgi:2-haloacid dehalogenase